MISSENLLYSHLYFKKFEVKMEKSYEDICNRALLSLHKEDAVRIIVDYLKEKISFDSFRASIFNTEDKSIVNFISYEEEFSDSYAYYNINTDSPLEVMENLYGKHFDEVYIKTKQKDVPKKQNKKHSTQFSSNMSICIGIDEEQKQFTYLKFSSNQKDIYTKKEADFLIELRPLLRDTICAYYTKYPEIALNISSQGLLPHNHLEQLKMCPNIRDVVKQIEIIAKYDTTVLLQGATGTGKELVAESIHALSERKNKPFIAVNCGAIAESLLESELFGSEKGAYTSSIQMHKGYFEQANNGTIYLDEIGELSKNAQKRLLRVLENHTIQRVGAEKSIKLDLRIIVATHRDLYQMVQENTFREDLFYRLNVYPIKIPSLAQRKKDIAILVKYFYRLYIYKFNIKNEPQISHTTLNYLTAYSWSGNVRQLRYALERALINAVEFKKKELDFTFLEDFYGTIVSCQNNTEKLKKKQNLFKEIQEALEKCNGKIQGKNGASALLGIAPSTLRSRMKSLGIKF